jgi:hypothetical protein
MFENEDEKWQQFRDLTEIMESAEHKQPAENFTSGVMMRLSEEKETSRLFRFRQLFSTTLNFGFSDYVTQSECAFYFFLTGFFYLVLGLILLLGLRLPSVLINSGWLSFQPVFGLILAAGLLLMGAVVYKDGDASMRFVRAGTMVYAALIIINGFTGVFFVRIPVTAFFDVIFSITGLGTALLLGLAVNRYYPKNISQEVHG